MATEEDAFENDPSTGKPLVHSFAYRVVYRWTSLYVHPTVGALWNHLVQAGRDVFKVRSGDRRDMRHMALFNTAAYLSNTMVAFYRCMDDPQPSRLGTWSGAIMAIWQDGMDRRSHPPLLPHNFIRYAVVGRLARIHLPNQSRCQPKFRMPSLSDVEGLTPILP